MKIRLDVMVVGLAFASMSVRAETPVAETVLDKYVQALGGRAAVEKLTSRVIKGTMDNSDDGTTSPIEVYAKAPALYASIRTVPDYGVVATIWNGSTGWTKNPESGIQAMGRTDAAYASRAYDFYRDLKLKQLYPTMNVSGPVEIAGSAAHIIEATSADGKSEKLYFDAKNGLLVRWDYERITFEDGIIPFEVYFEDYREVDGVKFPFTMRRQTPDYTLTFKFSDVKHNVPVDDAQFAKPEK
jgi:outer membrane lipoprotein-sorting protein